MKQLFFGIPCMYIVPGISTFNPNVCYKGHVFSYQNLENLIQYMFSNSAFGDTKSENVYQFCRKNSRAIKNYLKDTYFIH